MDYLFTQHNTLEIHLSVLLLISQWYSAECLYQPFIYWTSRLFPVFSCSNKVAMTIYILFFPVYINFDFFAMNGSQYDCWAIWLIYVLFCKKLPNGVRDLAQQHSTCKVPDFDSWHHPHHQIACQHYWVNYHSIFSPTICDGCSFCTFSSAFSTILNFITIYIVIVYHL